VEYNHWKKAISFEVINMDKKQFAAEIADMKREQKAVILAHNYQSLEVQAVADYCGDSLELSRIAARVEAEIIVFAGVLFMAETAKILAPEKKVLLPRLDAGCPMADMITVDELRGLKREFPKAAVVTYVNSAAAIKAESDICCTSANAPAVVRGLDADEIIFVPDRNLGYYVQKRVPEKKVHLYCGYCYVHDRFSIVELIEARKLYPGARVLVHPEVPPELQEQADEILSTSGMLRRVRLTSEKGFIVATEEGLLERMRLDNPAATIHSLGRPKICANMKKTGLIDVHRALSAGCYEIKVPEETAFAARHALDGMLRFQ